MYLSPHQKQQQEQQQQQQQQGQKCVVCGVCAVYDFKSDDEAPDPRIGDLRILHYKGNLAKLLLRSGQVTTSSSSSSSSSNTNSSSSSCCGGMQQQKMSLLPFVSGTFPSWQWRRSPRYAAAAVAAAVAAAAVAAAAVADAAVAACEWLCLFVLLLLFIPPAVRWRRVEAPSPPPDASSSSSSSSSKRSCLVPGFTIPELQGLILDAGGCLPVLATIGSAGIAQSK